MSLLNTSLSPISMIENASRIINPMIGLVFLLSTIMGLYMVAMGGYRMWRYGMLNVEDPRLTLSSIAWSIVIGSVMCGLAYFMGSSLLTFTGSASPSPLAYTGPGGQDVSTAIVDIMHFLQLLGILWFVSGMRMMYRLNTGNPRNNEHYDKVWWHLLGGLGLIDIAGAAMAIAHLAGTQLPF
ncbi:MAG: hypothetical protein M0003_09540 [Acidithiobacillus sp.]|nr:hypothetical protein [Acidithiobacillus sp.]